MTSTPHDWLAHERELLARVEAALKYELPPPDAVPVADKVAFFDALYAEWAERFCKIQNSGGSGQFCPAGSKVESPCPLPEEARRVMSTLLAWGVGRMSR